MERRTLTVCSYVSDPPDRVAAALTPLRAVATEIVVAVDARRWTRDDTAPLRDVADRVILREFVFPLEANLEWLHEQASSDWTLRLDGDEVPSTALVDRLATPGWDRDVTHVYVPRRWLWNDAQHTLDESPWWPDPQLRLVRRGSASFSTRVHEPLRVEGAARWLEEPIYHLDLLLAAHDERRRKALRYETRAPGVRTAGGQSQNSAYYLPELRTDRPRLLMIPGHDADLIGRVIGTSTPLAPVDHRPAQEPPDDHEVRVTVFDEGPRRWVADRPVTAVVRVHNGSDESLCSQSDPPVRVGGRIIDAHGRPWGAELRADLPVPLHPGATALVPLHVGAAPPPGRYRLEVGAVREGVAWFDSTAHADITVVEQRRVFVSAGHSPHRHLGDDLIVRNCLTAIAVELPDLEPVLAAVDPVDAAQRFGVRATFDATSVIHRHGPATLPEAGRRLIALRRDARRVARGEEPLDPFHRTLLSEVAASDAVVMLGAGWMTSAYRQPALLPKCAEAIAASALGVPLTFEGGTIGPLRGVVDRLLASATLRAARTVSLRDGEQSIRRGRRLGVRRGVLRSVPDVATWEPAPHGDEAGQWLRRSGLPADARWAVVSVRDPLDAAATDDDLTTAAVADCVEELASQGLAPVFLAHCSTEGSDDLRAARAIARRTRLLVPTDLPDDHVASTVIRQASAVVGDRFHLAAIADAAGVPGVLIARSAFDRQRAAALRSGSVRIVEDPAHARDALRAVTTDPPAAQIVRWSSRDFADRLRAVLRTRQPGMGK